MLRDLERTKQRYLQEELEIYFDDISDAAERIWDTLENYKEVIEALESTNESVLSHRLNDSFRILTAVSVVLLPLTLIASIFGMNVPVPGEGQEFAFLGILVLMGVAAPRPRRLLPAARLAVEGWLSSRRPRSMGDPRAAETPGFERWRCDAEPEEHRSRARRGAPGIRATRLGRGVRQPDRRRRGRRPRRRGPRAAGDHRVSCSGGPTTSIGGRSESPCRGRPNGRRRRWRSARAYGLGMERIQRGEMAQGGGWLARGARLVEETGYDGVERGFLLIPQALQALMAGRPADAFAIFEQVAAIAERFDDADLRTMGRLGRGQSLIAMGETRRGVAAPRRGDDRGDRRRGLADRVGDRLLRRHRGVPVDVRPPARAGVDRGARTLVASRSPTWSRSAATASSSAPS